MERYFDNSATTQPYPQVTAKVAEVMQNQYGNPSSLHRLGIAAEKEVKAAREAIAQTLKASPGEIYFTSGGTESNNLAIRGVCAASRGRQIISSPLEHPATLNTLMYLKKKGYRIDFIPVDHDGIISLPAFEDLLCDDTALVTVMLVNNEIGSVQPISRLAEIMKRKNKRAYLHVDAVQGYCKVPCDAKTLGADLLSISGHKIHGPKGIGVLYVKKGTKIAPILFGGGQQDNLRSGTENVPGIAGIGLAASLCYQHMATAVPRMHMLRQRLEKGLRENLSDIKINTPENCAPHILNVSFAGVRSEVVLHSLEDEEIYVSSGSACSSHKKEPSYVLTAIGTDRNMIDGSIRLSLSEFTTQDDIDAAVEALTRIVTMLRRIPLR
ncbi:cysteine desulfurase family protein [Ructibacterium gallinarum]|uniref:Cysteine desulfurase n=1 Tax=Ructibacterium gallinarum TaxID=2779355 RepID=A0A9D5M5P2_9FIRM|nr:cysteine desulfurase family protein [Ructibacterium gallinarum]MBE5040024.1 cysteine desulfurase [Ructibacterium gallinarum]